MNEQSVERVNQIVVKNMINMLLDDIKIPNEDDRIVLLLCLLVKMDICDEVRLLIDRVKERYGGAITTALETECSPWVIGIMFQLFPNMNIIQRSDSPTRISEISIINKN
jgi:hypothetical protein